jgi:hypothetical protein
LKSYWDNSLLNVRLQPKRPGHVKGDGDDGTTTRWEKARAMGEINLHLPRPPRHRPMRGIMWGIVGGTLVWLFVGLTAWAFYRAWPIIARNFL